MGDQAIRAREIDPRGPLLGADLIAQRARLGNYDGHGILLTATLADSLGRDTARDPGAPSRPAAWLGPRKWRLLHLIGGWYIWISFAVAVGKRVPFDSFYWPMAVLVLAIAALRLIAMLQRWRRRVTLGYGAVISQATRSTNTSVRGP